MEYIVGLIFGIPLFVLALLLCAGKCVSLLAGFHTSDQQEGYNAKKVGRFTGAFLIPMSVLVVLITSDNTAISVTSMILIVVLSVILIVLVNTLKYFKK
jgi:hypothetical protein